MVHIKGVFRTVGLLDLLQGPSQLRHRLQQRSRNSSSSSRRRGRCGRAACNCGGGAVAQEEPLLQRCGRCLQLSLQRADTLRENGTFFEFSLCLSRACLGKIIHFIYKWLKKCRFLADGSAQAGRAIAPRRPCPASRGALACPCCAESATPASDSLQKERLFSQV
jgi:hypothetical protein